MNRIVKFRGKRIDNGAWETGCAVVLRQGLIGEEWFISDKMTGYHTSVRRSTVGQFTGLYDKNGKEIYEGDIVTKYLDRDKFVCEYVEKYACFAFLENVKHGVLYYFQKCDEKDLEVIGNIHDNPELLK